MGLEARVNAPRIVTDGLEFYFHAAKADAGFAAGNNDDPTSEVFDLSDSGNNGTLVNFAYTAADGWTGSGTLASPYALLADGTTGASADKVALSYVGVAATKNFTFESWMWVNGSSTATHCAISECNSSATADFAYVGISSGKAAAVTRYGGSSSLVQSTAATYNDGSIHHVVAVADGTYMRVYADGALVAGPTAMSTGTPTGFNVTSLLQISRSSVYYAHKGGLVVVRAYSRPLSAAEVEKNYAAGYTWTPTTSRRAAPSISLLVGVSNDRYVDLGKDAVITNLEKAMPGGDGSLEFKLPGAAAARHRNYLKPIASEAVLRVNGESLFFGNLINDPVRHIVSVDDTVECVFAGRFALCARDESYGYVGKDTDLEEWEQLYNTSGDHSGRFTVHKDGKLSLRAHNDRTYPDGSRSAFYYWSLDGLTEGSGGPARIDITYAVSLVSGWKASMWSGWGGAVVAADDPGSGYDWQKVGPSTDSGTGTFDVSGDTVVMQLHNDSGVDKSNNVYFNISKFTVVGSSFDASDDPIDADYLGDAVRVLAFNAGVLNQNFECDSFISTLSYEQFVARFPTTIADALAAAEDVVGLPTEMFFDTTPDGLPRLVFRVRPTETALSSENRIWVVGDRPGEDVSGITVDFESTPERIEVIYSCLDDGTYKNGTALRAAYEPAIRAIYPELTFKRIEVVDITNDESLITATVAEGYAQSIYNQRQSLACSGNVVLPDYAMTSNGVEEPTWKMRPGDRLLITGRDDGDMANQTMYVTGTSFDFTTMKQTATVGEPFDPNDPQGERPSIRRRRDRKRRKYRKRWSRA